jgi:hypothetical protein
MRKVTFGFGCASPLAAHSASIAAASQLQKYKTNTLQLTRHGQIFTEKEDTTWNTV